MEHHAVQYGGQLVLVAGGNLLKALARSSVLLSAEAEGDGQQRRWQRILLLFTLLLCALLVQARCAAAAPTVPLRRHRCPLFCMSHSVRARRRSFGKAAHQMHGCA